jgi:hypothetical protein
MRGGCPGAARVLDWWFDSVGGSDSNLGRSPTSPKKTLNSVTKILPDGATLHLKRGSRFKETFDVNGKKLNVVDYGAGTKPLIDGSIVLDNANFSATSGHANVYQIAISFLGLDGAVIVEGANCSIQFFDGSPVPYSHGVDNRLKCANAWFNATYSWIDYGRTHAENLAYVRDNPGTFYAATTGGAVVDFPLADGTDQLVLYVHLIGDVNPITSGAEYSIGSNKNWVWYQRFGGTISNIWWARWSFQNHGYFERCVINDCEWSQAARHGPFNNDCVLNRCKSSGLYLSGASYHGYRASSVDGTSNGNVYVDCEAINGQWGFFSHGSGAVMPSLKETIIGGTITNVQSPVAWETLETSSVRGLTVNDSTAAIAGSSPIDWDNCTFHVKRTAAVDPPSSVLIAVFAGASNAHLTGCTIDGGDAKDKDGLDRYLGNDVGTGVVVENCTVTVPVSRMVSSQPITVINSVWPGT